MYKHDAFAAIKRTRRSSVTLASSCVLCGAQNTVGCMQYVTMRMVTPRVH